MNSRLKFFLFLAVVLGGGCANIELNPIPDLNRLVTGTVSFTEPATLPSDAVIVVRVLETSRKDGMSRIIGEQVIKGGGNSPIPYKVEFRAEDALVQRGMNIEARVAYDGKVQLFNGNTYAITPTDLSTPKEIVVEKISR